MSAGIRRPVRAVVGVFRFERTAPVREPRATLKFQGIRRRLPTAQICHKGLRLMNQRPAAIQELHPMPIETDAALRAARENVMENSTWVLPLQAEIARVIVGQKHLLDRLLVALLTNGHVLLEGVPGLAKTL